MFVLVRKNLAYLVTKHTSYVRKSYVPYPISLHFFSIWMGRQVDTTDRVYDVLVHKHQFSPEVASHVASHLPQSRSHVKADLILSFLEECGFSSNQLEKIVKYRPRILSYSVEDIKFKIKIFQELGLSSGDIKRLICREVMILHISAKNNIIPTLSSLKSLLGSNHDVARLIRISGRVILSNLENTLMPNIELLKSCGVPMKHIIYLLYCKPWCLLIKPDVMRKSVEKAKELGFNESSKKFVCVVHSLSTINEGMWEVKFQGFRDLGFSDSDTLSMFKRAPQVFNQSMKKIEAMKELLFATGKFNMTSIIRNPGSLGCSIEKRFKPRLRILGVLESRNLIKEWPTLGRLYTLSDAEFIKRYVRPYSDEVGEAFEMKSYVQGESKDR